MLRPITTALCLFAVVSETHAAITFYDNIIDWRAGINTTGSGHTSLDDQLDNLDSFVGVGTRTAGSENYTIGFSSTGSPAPTLGAVTSADFITSGTAAQAAYSGGGTRTSTITFSVPSVLGFALDIHDIFDTTGNVTFEVKINGTQALYIDAPTFGNSSATVEYDALINGTLTTVTSTSGLTIGDDDFVGAAGTFLGFAESDGTGSTINNIEILHTQSGTTGDDNYSFDNVIMTTSIPEPSTLIISLLGLGCMALRRQRTS